MNPKSMREAGRFAQKRLRTKVSLLAPMLLLGVITAGSSRAAAPGTGTTQGIIDIEALERPARAKQWVGKTGHDLVPESDGKCLWTFKDGVLTASPLWDSMITRTLYRDFQMHVEFNVNHAPNVDPEKNGNSGIYIQQRYEIQILNSYGVSEADYKPSYCGSLYRMKKPDKLVNKPAGQWQSFDMVFRAARFDGDKKVENARITVYQNQQLIHDDVSMPRQTGAGQKEGPEARPIKLQGHHNEVQFRNVWVETLRLDTKPGEKAMPAQAGMSPYATLRLANAFSDHMILQRDKPIRIWGFARPGQVVTVAFAGQKKNTRTGNSGTWSLHLEPLGASVIGQNMVVRSGQDALTLGDVLVGDIWVLGGQSNMEASLKNIQDGELEILSANHPLIRLLTVPLNAHPKPQDDFSRLNEYNAWSRVTERKGEWSVCTPETVPLFSAVGYVFGRRLHGVTGVPIGLVDTSWGGTTVEAWISRKTLAAIDGASPLLASWDKRIEAYSAEQSLADLERRWTARAETQRKQGREIPPKPTAPNPSPAFDRNNPGAAYNAILAPMAGMAVKGAVFYQGINNAVGGARPALYAKTFAAMIPEWQQVFRDAKLPFGICQMVSWGFPPEIDRTEELMASPAPFIRESQLQAHLTRPETGFVVAYDLGHIQMHSPFKVPLGERLARWALATQYGKTLTYKTPLYQSMHRQDAALVCEFDTSIHPRHGGRAKILGFAIAGEDRHFYPALAKMVKDNAVRVSSVHVPAPVAVRYAWATHPFGTLVGAGSNGLPAAPFRTDDWAWPDAPFAERGSPEDQSHRAWQKSQQIQAAAWAKERREKEARRVLGQATTSTSR